MQGNKTVIIMLKILGAITKENLIALARMHPAICAQVGQYDWLTFSFYDANREV
jgi:hypothetical protein